MPLDTRKPAGEITGGRDCQEAAIADTTRALASAAASASLSSTATAVAMPLLSHTDVFSVPYGLDDSALTFQAPPPCGMSSTHRMLRPFSHPYFSGGSDDCTSSVTL